MLTSRFRVVGVAAGFRPPSGAWQRSSHAPGPVSGSGLLVDDRPPPGDPGRPANVADLVRNAAAADPRHPALLGAHGSVSWGEIDANVSRLARAFGTLGMLP